MSIKRLSYFSFHQYFSLKPHKRTPKEILPSRRILNTIEPSYQLNPQFPKVSTRHGTADIQRGAAPFDSHQTYDTWRGWTFRVNSEDCTVFDPRSVCRGRTCVRARGCSRSDALRPGLCRKMLWTAV